LHLDYYTKMDELDKEEAIKTTFDLLDSDKDGNIDVKELEKFILSQGMNIPPEELQELVERIDTNGDGKIQYGEFKLCMDKIITKEDEESFCRQIFDMLDRGSDKVISIEELKYAFYCLGEPLTDDDVRHLIQFANGNNNREEVTFEEFSKIYKKSM